MRSEQLTSELMNMWGADPRAPGFSASRNLQGEGKPAYDLTHRLQNTENIFVLWPGPQFCRKHGDDKRTS